MKFVNILFSSLMFFGLFSCTPTKKISTAANTMETLFSNFEKSVAAHDWDGVVASMDADYKKEQLEDMLKGDQKQFLQEFFCGQVVKRGRGFKCMELDVIDKVQRMNVTDDGRVIYQIIGKDDVILEASWFVKQNETTKNFGLVGSVG